MSTRRDFHQFSYPGRKHIHHQAHGARIPDSCTVLACRPRPVPIEPSRTPQRSGPPTARCTVSALSRNRPCLAVSLHPSLSSPNAWQVRRRLGNLDTTRVPALCRESSREVWSAVGLIACFGRGIVTSARGTLGAGVWSTVGRGVMERVWQGLQGRLACW
jgi:hypothetical protein